MEQEAAMAEALQGVTEERVGAVLAPLGLKLLKLEPFASPFGDGDVVQECTFEAIAHGPVPPRRFANNAVFSVSTGSDNGKLELILRVSNALMWRRRRMTDNEVASMRWAAAHGVPHIPKILSYSADAASSP